MLGSTNYTLVVADKLLKNVVKSPNNVIKRKNGRVFGRKQHLAVNERHWPVLLSPPLACDLISVLWFNVRPVGLFLPAPLWFSDQGIPLLWQLNVLFPCPESNDCTQDASVSGEGQVTIHSVGSSQASGLQGHIFLQGVWGRCALRFRANLKLLRLYCSTVRKARCLPSMNESIIINNWQYQQTLQIATW